MCVGTRPSRSFLMRVGRAWIWKRVCGSPDGGRANVSVRGNAFLSRAYARQRGGRYGKAFVAPEAMGVGKVCVCRNASLPWLYARRQGGGNVEKRSLLPRMWGGET